VFVEVEKDKAINNWFLLSFSVYTMATEVL